MIDVYIKNHWIVGHSERSPIRIHGDYSWLHLLINGYRQHQPWHPRTEQPHVSRPSTGSRQRSLGGAPLNGISAGTGDIHFLCKMTHITCIANSCLFIHWYNCWLVCWCIFCISACALAQAWHWGQVHLRFWWFGMAIAISEYPLFVAESIANVEWLKIWGTMGCSLAFYPQPNPQTAMQKVVLHIAENLGNCCNQ